MCVASRPPRARWPTDRPTRRVCRKSGSEILPTFQTLFVLARLAVVGPKQRHNRRRRKGDPRRRGGTPTTTTGEERDGISEFAASHNLEAEGARPRTNFVWIRARFEVEIRTTRISPMKTFSDLLVGAAPALVSLCQSVRRGVDERGRSFDVFERAMRGLLK